MGGLCAGSHLPLGFPEEHLISAPEGFSEGSCGVCGQLWLAGSVGVYMHSGIPRSVHTSVTIKHGKVGAVHRVLVGNAVGVTTLLVSCLTEAVNRPEPLVCEWSPGAD